MKRKYKITLVKYNFTTYYFVCTRTYISCLKLGFRHIFNGNAMFFIIKKYNKKYIIINNKVVTIQ